MNLRIRRPPPATPRPPTDDGTGDAGWVARLRRHIGRLLLVKLCLLLALFFLFFSAAHRPDIDAAGISERLQLQGDTP